MFDFGRSCGPAVAFLCMFVSISSPLIDCHGVWVSLCKGGRINWAPCFIRNYVTKGLSICIKYIGIHGEMSAAEGFLKMVGVKDMRGRVKDIMWRSRWDLDFPSY